MAKKRIQQSDEEIARRAMDLARQISGRLFVSRDGVYLISGIPAFKKLRHCLAGVSQPPETSAAPTPMDLGFAPNQITPLTEEQLTTWGRGLQKWRKILNDYEKPRQKTSERRHKYRRWKDEIGRLSCTLEHLWQTLREWENGQPVPGAPYVSEHTAEIATPGGGVSDARLAELLWAWLERLVIWIAGPAAGQRFHGVLTPFTEDRTTREDQELVVRALSRLRSVQCNDESLSKLELATAVRDVLADIPEELQADFGLRIPKRPRDFNIESIVSTFEKAVDRKLPPVTLVGSAAALFATDGATALVPPWLVSPGDAEAIDARTQVFMGLFDEHAEAGYDPLLRALAMIRNVSRRDIRAIRQWLVIGVETGDIKWALKALSWRARQLAGEGLSPQPFRALASVLEPAGLNVLDMGPNDTDLCDVVEKVSERGSADIVEAFALWLSSLSPAALDANLARWSWNCLCQLLVLEGTSPALRSHLKRWTDPPASGTRDELLTTPASTDMQVWLSKLCYYQRLCGQRPALPQSVVKILHPGDREAREREYLRKAKDRGQLSDGMARRLALLDSRDAKSRIISEHRALKQIQETCARAALDAVRLLARREGRYVWELMLRCEPQQHLTDDEVTAIAAWAAGLDKRPLKCLRELLDAWRESGIDYRGRLSLNAAWTRAATDHVDLHAWYAPSPLEVAVEGLPIRVCVAPHPYRVLLMGTYFGTCLSLDDFNKDSVLANAYDANKSVVFALGSEGRVLARKLVCINSDFRLIGYRTYVAADESLTNARRELVSSLVDVFCGRWARRAGLPLAFAGTSAKLSGLFWYDDGVTHWTPNAMRAWADPSANAELVASTHSGLTPQVSSALEARLSECIRLITELGIWPHSGKAPSGLADVPSLAEESLAILARTELDCELARVMFENATTLGGQLEAMTSVAILEKTDEMTQHVFSVGKQGSGWAERAMEILRCVGSRKAWQLFMRLVVQEDIPHHLWLSLAAADSDSSADALFEALLSPGPCELDYRQLLLANEILSARGKTLPQAAVLKALLSDFNGPAGKCFLAQWMPACPDALKRAYLERIAQTDDFWEHANEYASMAAIIIAMSNPGPRSTAHLRPTSANDPRALLALSLQAGGKYRDFIRKTALAASDEPAAILALLVSEGEEAAVELLSPTCSSLPNQKKRVDHARQLHAAFRDLECGKPVSCFTESNRSGEALSTLPFVLHWLSKWVDADRPNIAAIGALMGSGNCTDSLKAHGVDLCGLAARMAGLLRKSDGTSTIVLREALLALLDQGGMRQLWNYALLLDKVSGQRLWSGGPAGDHTPVPIDDTLGCAGVWELLLDEAGNTCPVVEKLDWSDVWGIRLPMDVRLAARVAQLLPARAPADELTESMLPMTEIQKRLVNRYIEPKND